MALYDANDNDKIEACEKGAFGQLLSLLYMENSDQRKYGLLMNGLGSCLGAQQSLGNDPYPTSITKASEVLSKCPFDNTGKQPRIKDKDRNDRNDRNDKYRGNDNKNSQNNDEPVPMSFAQMEGKCYCCGKTGHRSNSCRDKDKAKVEWLINKAKIDRESHAQVKEEESSSSINKEAPVSSISSASKSSKGTKDRTVGWVVGAHIEMQFFQADELRTWILLDNELSTSIFCNKNYVKDIQEKATQLWSSIQMEELLRPLGKYSDS
eukprot:scaffold332106_cov58-Attheya_sp.AAC.2